MYDRKLGLVLLLVGSLSLLAALLFLVSGRAEGIMDVFYPLLFGVIFLGEYIRHKYFKKGDGDE